MVRQQDAISSSAPRVLVAEKNAAHRNSLSNFLKQKGFIPTTVGTGEEALKEIQKNPPDICLLEIIMPKLLGTEVCLTVKQSEPLTEIPIILMSSGVKEFDEANAPDLEFRADDYLLKPFPPQLLLDKIQAHLQRAQTRKEKSQKGKSVAFNVDDLVTMPEDGSSLEDLKEQAESLKITRENARVPLNIVVNYESANIFFSSATMNISKGGFFIRTNNPLPIGQVIKLKFNLPDDKKSIDGYGRVVWTEKPQPGKISGMGIRFKDFSSKDLDLIFSYVTRLKEFVH